MKRIALVLPAALVCFAAAALTAPAGAAPATKSTAKPAATGTTTTPIKHFVTLLQENHSFDNYFGTFPGADGIPATACMPNDPHRPASGCVKPFPIAGRASASLADNHAVFSAQYALGAMNGFVSAYSKRGAATDLPMAHYSESDISYYWAIANQYVLFDHYFSSASGGSLWNHMYWMTATPGNPHAEKVPAGGFGDLPTIFDRLDARGISWKVYIQNYDAASTFRAKGPEPAQVVRAPVLAFARFVDDPQLAAHIVPLDDYYSDLEKGALPAVSYIVPAGPSEHPPGNVQSGEAFVGNVVTALKVSTAWPTSAFMLSYDDWGGWYDHVAPPKVDAFGLGFRVPALLVSPYAKRGYVDGTQLDHTSLLKFIEDNWGLPPLSTRDARANDLLSAFDFHQQPRPPELLSSEAASPTVVSGHSGIIYPAYGGAVLVALAFIGGASVASRRRKRKVAA
jgi:phospholipase C